MDLLKYKFPATRDRIEAILAGEGIVRKLNGFSVLDKGNLVGTSWYNTLYMHLNTDEQFPIEYSYYTGQLSGINDANIFFIMSMYFEQGMMHDIIIFYKGVQPDLEGQSSYLYSDQRQKCQDAALEGRIIPDADMFLSNPTHEIIPPYSLMKEQIHPCSPFGYKRIHPVKYEKTSEDFKLHVASPKVFQPGIIEKNKILEFSEHVWHNLTSS